MYKIIQNFWVLFHLFTFVEAMESHRDIWPLYNFKENVLWKQIEISLYWNTGLS